MLAQTQNTRTPQERARARAAAEEILEQDAHESWERNLHQMARGTLAALDWVEGHRATAPSTGTVVRPDDVLEDSASQRLPALVQESSKAEAWGGYVQPPHEDIHYHGAVWALLRWWQNPHRRETLAIDVPDLTP